MLGGLVRRLCHLYPGEGRKALQLSLLAFLCSLATFAAFTLSDGLFLEHIGAHRLSLTYFFTACGLFAFAGGSLWALNRFPVRLLFLGSTLVQCAIYGVFAVGLASGANFYMAMKIAADGLWIVMITGLWSFLDECYDLQDAKRVFGMLNASIILGAAAGGGLVSLILRVGSPVCLFGTVSLILLAAVWVTSWVTRHAEHNAEGELPSAGSLMRGIFRSRFTMYLLFFCTLMIILELLAEFHYMSALQSILGPEGNVARFLGSARAWTYVGAVIFAVCIYGRSVRRVGVNNLLLTTPLAFLFLFSSWSVSAGLAMAVAGLVLVEGFDVAITDTNFNLAINGVPARLRCKVRVLAQYFIEPVGMIVAAGLLAVVPSKLIGLVVALVMLGVALVLRRTYARAIFHDLTESAICFGRPLESWLSPHELAILGVEPKEVETQSLKALLDRRHLDAILDRAYIYFYHSETLKEHALLRDCLLSSYWSLVSFAVHALGTAGGVEDSRLIMRALRSDNHKIHSQAVETLEKHCDKRLFNKLLPLIDDRPLLSKLRLYLKRGHAPLTLEELLDLLERSPSRLDGLVAAAMRSEQPMAVGA